MRWQEKAAISRAFATIPFGDKAFRFAQRHFGRLESDPTSRLRVAQQLAQWVSEAGDSISGRTVLEVGTGHDPIVPIAFSLLGAEKLYTLDLHRRVDIGIVRGSLYWMTEQRGFIHELLGGLGNPATIDQGLAAIDLHKEDPLTCMKALRIDYRAPGDASNTGLPDCSVDLQFSVATFEHIPSSDIRAIMREARRVLSPTGFAIHFIDPSDHFAHTDPSISFVNFLRYSVQEWKRIAGNEFAYCNRLRRHELRSLLISAGFQVVREESVVDDRSLDELRSGFPLDEAFREMSHEELSAIGIRLLIRPEVIGRET